MSRIRSLHVAALSLMVSMKALSGFFSHKSNHKSRMDAAEKERVSVKKLRLVEWREERREGDGVVEPPSLPGDRTWTRATQLHCGIVLHSYTVE